MEYRKRTRRRNKRRTSGAGEGAGGKLLLTLLLLGGAVYLLSASAAGTWVAQNVMAPIFEAFTPKDDINAPVLSTESSGDPRDSAEVRLSGMKMYLLQMGVFSKEDNALETASAYKKRGAGGYVMKDGDSYRVMASAYSTKDDAKTVRDRLKTEGVESAVHEIALDEISFSVTADTGSREAVSQAFSCLSGSILKMTELSQEFDRESCTVSDGVGKLKSIADDIKEKRDALSKTGASDDVIKSVLRCFDEYVNAVDAAMSYGGDNTVEFTSELKYTLIEMIDKYAVLIEGLSA